MSYLIEYATQTKFCNKDAYIVSFNSWKVIASNRVQFAAEYHFAEMSLYGFIRHTGDVLCWLL